MKKNLLIEGVLQNHQCLKIKMTTEQFAYWLQGYVEITNSEPTKEQWKIIKDHLQLVFNKVTPNYTINSPSYTPITNLSCGIPSDAFKNINTNPLATNIKIC